VRGVRVLALGAVLPVLALVARPADAQSLSPQEVFRRVSSSVVVIEVTDDDNKVIASGSGVVIPNRFKDGILKLNQVLVATNCHVVDQAPDGRVTLRQGDIRGWGRINGRDASRDLCTIRGLLIDSPELPASQVGSSQWLEVGDSVYAVGAPKGLELTLSNGIVSGFREHEGNEYIQTTAPISRGSSGGGLFDAQGRLVGITTMYVKDGQALNFTIPAELIASVPEFQPERRNVSNPTTGQPPPLTTASDADSRWIYVTDADDAALIYLDKKTAKRSGQDVTAWWKSTYKSPQKDKTGDVYDETSHLNVFHCSTRQFSRMSFVQRLRGKAIYSHDFKNYEVERKQAQPETVGEALLELACSL